MSNVDFDELRQRAKKRVDARREFREHLAYYIVINLFLWGLWFFVTGAGFPWPIIVMMAWGIGIFSHALEVSKKTNMAEIRRELDIEREMQRELEYRGLSDEPVYSKPKRSVRLSDDGELIDAEDQENKNKISNAGSR